MVNRVHLPEFSNESRHHQRKFLSLIYLFHFLSREQSEKTIG